MKDFDAKFARFILLEKTAEYQQSKLHNHLQEINKALLCVIQNPESLQRKMYCWSRAIFLLDDELFDYGIKLLINSKRLPENQPTYQSWDVNSWRYPASVSIALQRHPRIHHVSIFTR